jgi:hypothetical protein
MNNEKFKNYAYDLGILFKNKAKEAKYNTNDLSKIENAEDVAYKMGYLMAFHEIIDVMKQQATAFNIEQEDIGLADIDAESDLL